MNVSKKTRKDIDSCNFPTHLACSKNRFTKKITVCVDVKVNADLNKVFSYISNF
jgi:hypothetical protein